MIEIENKKKYYSYIRLLIFYTMLGFVFFIAINPRHIIFMMALFFVLVGIIVSQKFTHKIKLDSTGVFIEYSAFLFKKNIVVLKNEMDLKLLKRSSFRAREFYELQILKDNKIVYTIDSRDGFEFDDMNQFVVASKN